jgi:hypothetical protein
MLKCNKNFYAINFATGAEKSRISSFKKLLSANILHMNNEREAGDT